MLIKGHPRTSLPQETQPESVYVRFGNTQVKTLRWFRHQVRVPPGSAWLVQPGEFVSPGSALVVPEESCWEGGGLGWRGGQYVFLLKWTHQTEDTKQKHSTCLPELAPEVHLIPPVRSKVL